MNAFHFLFDTPSDLPEITLINSAAIVDERLSDSEFRALAYQSGRANHLHGHIAFPSVATAARDLNKSPNCVRDGFHAALALGYTSVVGYTPGGVVIYSVQYPASFKPSSSSYPPNFKPVIKIFNADQEFTPSTTVESPPPPPWSHNKEENKEKETTTTAGVVSFSVEEKAGANAPSFPTTQTITNGTSSPILEEPKASWCPQITVSQGQEIDDIINSLPEHARDQVRVKLVKALASKRIANPVEYAKVAVANKRQDLERFAASRPKPEAAKPADGPLAPPPTLTEEWMKAHPLLTLVWAMALQAVYLKTPITVNREDILAEVLAHVDAGTIKATPAALYAALLKTTIENGGVFTPNKAKSALEKQAEQDRIRREDAERAELARQEAEEKARRAAMTEAEKAEEEAKRKEFIARAMAAIAGEIVVPHPDANEKKESSTQPTVQESKQNVTPSTAKTNPEVHPGLKGDPIVAQDLAIAPLISMSEPVRQEPLVPRPEQVRQEIPVSKPATVVTGEFVPVAGIIGNILGGFCPAFIGRPLVNGENYDAARAKIATGQRRADAAKEAELELKRAELRRVMDGW